VGSTTIRNVLRVVVCAAFLLCGAAAAFAQDSDLNVSKTGPATANADTDVTFTITVTNLGPDAASSVALTDNIITGWTFVSFAQNSGPAFNCTTPNLGDSSGSVNCTLDPMAAGDTAVFSLVLHIPPATPAGTEFTNVATVSSPSDPNDENNSSTAVT